MGGRHTDPDRGAFWRSLGTAAAKALLVLALLAGLTTLVVTVTGDQDEQATVLAERSPTPTPSPPPTPTPDAAPDAPDDTDEAAMDSAATGREDAPDDDPGEEEPADEAGPTPTPAADVTVQVIDSGGGSDAAAEVVALLDGWGYDVVAVNPGLCCFEATTLFYSAGRAADAEALQARDERFAVVEENHRLDESVALHVVVGEDWDAP